MIVSVCYLLSALCIVTSPLSVVAVVRTAKLVSPPRENVDYHVLEGQARRVCDETRSHGGAHISHAYATMLMENAGFAVPLPPPDEGGRLVVQTTLLTGTTPYHTDCVDNEEGIMEKVDKGTTVAFVAMNTNPDAYFFQQEERIPIVEGQMIQFDGSIAHNTVIEKGIVTLLGPFSLPSFEIVNKGPTPTPEPTPPPAPDKCFVDPDYPGKFYDSESYVEGRYYSVGEICAYPVYAHGYDNGDDRDLEVGVKVCCETEMGPDCVMCKDCSENQKVNDACCAWAFWGDNNHHRELDGTYYGGCKSKHEDESYECCKCSDGFKCAGKDDDCSTVCGEPTDPPRPPPTPRPTPRPTPPIYPFILGELQDLTMFPERLVAIVNDLGGNMSGAFAQSDDIVTLNERSILRNYADSALDEAIHTKIDGDDDPMTLEDFGILEAEDINEDLRFVLNPSKLGSLISPTSMEKMYNAFKDYAPDFPVSHVIIRRTSLSNYGKHVQYHHDGDTAIMCVWLNDDGVDGGNIIYLNQDGATKVVSKPGSAVLHRNKVVHGITPMDGTRYMLILSGESREHEDVLKDILVSSSSDIVVDVAKASVA